MIGTPDAMKEKSMKIQYQYLEHIPEGTEDGIQIVFYE
jgi:hypothetical protein